MGPLRAVIAVALLSVFTYTVGGPLRSRTHDTARLLWLSGLTVEWILLTVLTPDATFLVFPLFFLYLHLLPLPWSVLSVGASTAAAVLLFAGPTGWSPGGVLGPTIRAAVATAIGLPRHPPSLPDFFTQHAG